MHELVGMGYKEEEFKNAISLDMFITLLRTTRQSYDTEFIDFHLFPWYKRHSVTYCYSFLQLTTTYVHPQDTVTRVSMPMILCRVGTSRYS